MRRRAKVDRNQSEIVDALRKAGCSVQPLHAVGAGVPDLLVGVSSKNFLLEVKAENGTLTERQVAWHEVWRGSVYTVKTAQEALEVMGVGHR